MIAIQTIWEKLSLLLAAKQRSAPPKNPRACLSQAPTKRGVCTSLPATLLPVDATHVATAPNTPAAIQRHLVRAAVPPRLFAVGVAASPMARTCRVQRHRRAL
jgi:hypothetical protein